LVETFDLGAEEIAEANFDDIVDAGVDIQISEPRIAQDEVLDGAIITHDTTTNILIGILQMSRLSFILLR